jgi:chromosome segregation ATPase
MAMDQYITATHERESGDDACDAAMEDACAIIADLQSSLGETEDDLSDLKLEVRELETQLCQARLPTEDFIRILNNMRIYIEAEITKLEPPVPGNPETITAQ